MHNVSALLLTTIALLIVNFGLTNGGFACLSNPCVHGVCLDDLNTTYSCYCIDGYTGVQCQTNWDECWSNPCLNGGLCLDGIAAFNCTCPAGFMGDLCEENLNECLSNPCQNNGTCLDAANGYFCNCLPGYSGVHCDTDIAVCNLTNETRCSNGGMCVEGPGVTFSCRCPEGWTGFLCELEIDECMSHPCQNGAVCVDLHADYECACLFGFAGRNCEEVVLICDDNPCKNDALCLMEEDKPVCYCVPDYHGERCQYQYDECKLSNNRCLNGGSCIDGVDGFTCSCPPKLTGVYCECLILELKGGTYLDCGYIKPTTLVTNVTFTATTEIAPITNTETILTTLSTTTTNLPTTTTSTTRTEPETETTIITTETTETTTETTTTEVPKTETPATTNAEITTTTIEEVTTTPLSTKTTETTIITTTEIDVSPTSSSIMTTTESEPPTYSSITTETTTPVTETTTGATVTATSEATTLSTTNMDDTNTSPTSTSTMDITQTTPQSTETTETTLMTTTETTTEFVPTPVPTIPVIPTFNISEPTTITTELPITESTATTLITSSTPSSTSEITTEIITSTSTEASTLSTFTITTETEADTTFSTTTEETTLPPIITTMSTTTTEFPLVTDFTTITTTSMETTTEIETTTETTTAEGPTIAPFDCSKTQQTCQNGGTCIYSEGFRCACPYDYSGDRCDVALGIRTAAFNGNSYLLHQVHTKSKLQVDFKARTTSGSGLLFYTNIEDTYMALYMEQGHLKFKFSCGYQTMLLSELNKPVNNGKEMRISALLTFSEDLKHCNASIKLNNTLSMSGAQMAKFDNFGKSKSWLYLGGLNEKANPIAKLPGFVGCMSDLYVLSKPLQIFKDAEDGFGITECSSLACLSNPCFNGGTCTAIPGKDSNKYFCKCRNGYVGLQCERSVCDNNPCKYGGTCLPFTGSGYICLCPYGKHGHYCENDLKISKAFYSSSVQGYASYTSYPIPKSTYKYMQIKFRITPSHLNQIALLMFMGQQGQHDFYSDHIAVSFVKGYIMLTWNLGSGPRRIFTTKPIPADKASYEIQLGRLGRRAWLFVEHLGNVTGRSQGTLTQLDVEPVIYFGGYKSKDFEDLPHDLPLHGGFSGCIFDMEFKIGDVPIALGNGQVGGRAVGQCGTTECYDGVCQNQGACLYHGGTFTCLCQDEYYGPLCSSKHNSCDRNSCAAGAICSPMIAGYECDCPLERKNKYCDKNETLSDISFTGTRSYVVLPSRHLEINKVNFDLELRPLTDGLVVFIGKDTCFFSVTLLSGLLELRVMPRRQNAKTQEVVVVRSNKMLRLGAWHQIKIQIYGRKIYLFVDNIVNTGILQPGDVVDLNKQKIFLGGLPDLSKLPQEATSDFPTCYTGCLRKIFIDTVHVALNENTIITGQNIVDCDGTPCGGDYCSNGGTCWLDPNLKPHCNCNEPYFGEKCEKVYDCTEHKCKNQGYCLEGRCICRVGYIGALCETGLTIRNPKFIGRSYLYVNAPNTTLPPNPKSKDASKKRNLFSSKIPSNILFVFMTATDGLLLFANDRSKRHSFAIGLQNGKLTLVDDNHSLELLSAPMLNDGFEHLLELKFAPFRLFLDAQEYDVGEFSRVEFDDFYLGGMPTNTTIDVFTLNVRNIKNEEAQDLEELFGGLMFDGCINNLKTNIFGGGQEDMIDFNSFNGENIEDCSRHFQYQYQ